ncbi:MAG: NAD-binding protein, partial [Pseudobdellovibrionaceae bacterium]
MKILVIGAGYVGLASAVGWASFGHTVFVYDKSIERRKALNEGIEPGGDSELQSKYGELQSCGRLCII